MAFVECLRVPQEDTTEDPLWRKTLGRSLGAHDAAELVSRMCHGNGCWQETTRLYAINCTKTGWSSLTHNRVLHQALARSLRESKVQFVVEDTWPFRDRASGQKSCSTIGEGGDTTIPSPQRSPKHPLPGIGLHDPLHGRQACPESNSFLQGVGQICTR